MLEDGPLWSVDGWVKKSDLSSPSPSDFGIGVIASFDGSSTDRVRDGGAPLWLSPNHEPTPFTLDGGETAIVKKRGAVECEVQIAGVNPAPDGRTFATDCSRLEPVKATGAP